MAQLIIYLIVYLIIYLFPLSIDDIFDLFI